VRSVAIAFAFAFAFLTVEPARAATSAEAPLASGLCVADSVTLCLQGNRFKVQGGYLLENGQGLGDKFLPVQDTDAFATCP
jgi:hypothetical protein